MKNSVGWFEIPTKDIKRAKKFYAYVFETDFQDVKVGDSDLSIFHKRKDTEGITGALLYDKKYIPSLEGIIIYFSCEDVNIEIKRIEKAGGEVVIPKTAIGEFGFFAHFIDTEGNKIGIHSNK